MTNFLYKKQVRYAESSQFRIFLNTGDEYL